MAHSQKKIPFTTFEILPSLFLSRFPEEIPPEITHVLNMCTTPHSHDSRQHYLHIALDDIDDITLHIPKTIDFISQALQNDSKVLVHCALGLNRPPAAIIAYFCHQNQINSVEALKLVQAKSQTLSHVHYFLSKLISSLEGNTNLRIPLSGSIGDYNKGRWLCYKNHKTNNLPLSIRPANTIRCNFPSRE